MASASVPASSFWLASRMDGNREAEINLFSQVAFGHGVYHSNRKQARMCKIILDFVFYHRAWGGACEQGTLNKNEKCMLSQHALLIASRKVTSSPCSGDIDRFHFLFSVSTCSWWLCVCTCAPMHREATGSSCDIPQEDTVS